MVECGWRTHHEHMTSDREFLDWAPAWHTHCRMLCTRFMLKPFILDPCSAMYEKQFECCKLNQALLGTRGSSHDYIRSQPRPADNAKHFPDTHQFQATLVPSSPHYVPKNSFACTRGPHFLSVLPRLVISLHVLRQQGPPCAGLF